MPPTRANGKICYVQIPTDAIAQSAEFYKRVFGWNVRKRNDGSTAFDDGVGEVSGEWVLKQQPAPAGLIVYIMVDSVESDDKARGGEWRRDRASYWRGRTRDHRALPRSGRQHARAISGTGVEPGFAL
jgi:catechol 2,3-dioxygenase-like lactoylglutathione lyase family enzyme